MQALQFLKGLSQLPAQKEAVSPSRTKESNVSSFKSVLENESRKDSNIQKTDYKSTDGSSEELKNESVLKAGAEASQVRKGKSGENESEKQENITCRQDSQQLAVCDDDTAVLYARSGEEVLFGQPVEQVTGSQLAMDISPAGLEDVTESETISDIRLNPRDVAALAAIPASVAGDGAKSMIPVQDKLSAPQFEELLESGELPADEIFVPELAGEAEFVPVMQEQAGTDGDDASETADFGNKFLAEVKESTERGDTAPASVRTESKQENRFIIQDNRSVEAKKETVTKAAPAELKAESVRQHGNTLDITFNLNQEQGQLLAAEQNILSTSDQVAAGDASTFQRMLSNQLLNQAPEFVKAGSIILRDNNNGTINLNLKPESLGNVKITLHVSDKGIEGQIVVASKEAFEAFSQNMDNLKQSFRQSGFDAANLSLSLSDGSSAQGQNLAGNAGGHQRSGEDFVGSRTFGGWTDGEEKLPSQTIAAAYGAGGHQIDVVA